MEIFNQAGRILSFHGHVVLKFLNLSFFLLSKNALMPFFIQLHSELWHYLTYSAHASTGSHVQIYNHSSPSQLYSPYNRW